MANGEWRMPSRSIAADPSTSGHGLIPPKRVPCIKARNSLNTNYTTFLSVITQVHWCNWRKVLGLYFLKCKSLTHDVVVQVVNELPPSSGCSSEQAWLVTEKPTSGGNSAPISDLYFYPFFQYIDILPLLYRLQAIDVRSNTFIHRFGLGTIRYFGREASHRTRLVEKQAFPSTQSAS